MPPLSTAGLMRDDLPPLSPSAGTWCWCPGLKASLYFQQGSTAPSGGGWRNTLILQSWKNNDHLWSLLRALHMFQEQFLFVRVHSGHS